MSQNPENSDSDEWEVVDVISNSKTISTKSPKLQPQLSTGSNSGIQTQRLYNSSHGSLININVNNGRNDEEKQSLLISSKITESRDLNDLNRKHDMKQSLYQTQLDIYKQKQKEYLQNWSSKQNFNQNNNNKNNKDNNNEELLKIKNQKERQEQELRRMKDLCEKYLREKEKLENEISKQREHNQEMQKFTQQILENQSKYQLEHQKQILNMQNNKNNKNNKNNNNQNQNQNQNQNNNNNNNNNDSREFSVLNVDEDYNTMSWQCRDCNFVNDEASKFCKKCAKLNPLFGGSLVNNNNNYNNNNNNNNNVINYNNILPSNEPLLQNEGLVGENKCLPCEKRQIGWILQNISNNSLIFNSLSLEILSESKNTTTTNKIEIDEILNKKLYKLDVKKNEEFYLFINYKAPSIPGKYTYFFNLYDINKPNRKILKPLQLVLQVKKQYDSKKENAIKQLLQMNITSDREAIVYLLEQHKWNLENTADALLEQFQD